jgi:diketogulonate reductase-like aldo/keto reductase
MLSAQASSIECTSILANGVSIPFVGFGTYRMNKENIKASLPAALGCGYRLIDTAASYRNEKFIGEEINRYFSDEISGISRSDLFIESKLGPGDQGYDRAKAAILQSLKNLNLDYIDLYIIHWPGSKGLKPDDPLNKSNRIGSWKALEEGLLEGKLRSIGVSNYSIRHLEEMKTYATTMPMVNQIEVHPLYCPIDLISYCQHNNIFVQAYSPLGQGSLLSNEFISSHPKLKAIAESYSISLSQVYLRWALQHGWGILPKSNDPSRVKENASLYNFELTSVDMDCIDSIQSNNLDGPPKKICWDPDIIV